jgi:hypothetical protein
MGDLLGPRGDTEKAAMVYQAGLNLDPFLTEVRQRLERLREVNGRGWGRTLAVSSLALADPWDALWPLPDTLRVCLA